MKILHKFVWFILILIIGSASGQITYQRDFEDVSFRYPTEIQFLKTDTERMFVVEQEGKIQVFPKQSDVSSSQVTTFLNITDRVRFVTGQEVGLLGLAFHPQYTTNGYFYVYYTATSPIDGIDARILISRFSIDPNNQNQADPDSELIIFRVDKNQGSSNHNGGKIAFGPDGYLYFSVGDGGGSNDPQNNAQNKNNVFGSICRIDIDLDGNNPLEANPDQPIGRYEIPSDNPFSGNTGNGLDEIFAYGIRNTWKFSFDEVTGRLWGADVGQGAFEEVNLIENGKNYGWKRFEGYEVANNVSVIGPTTMPVHVYNRNQGDRSVTGGYVYHGSEITSLSPDITGKYIFADYVSGRVWVLDYDPSTNRGNSTLLFKTDGVFVSSFGVDSKGEHYFSDYGKIVGVYKLKNGVTEPTGVAVDGVGTWTTLAEGITGIVQSIAASPDGTIYYGGTFNKAGTTVLRNIAAWNPSNGWSGLGTGANGAINSIAVAESGDVYAAGAFTEIGGQAINNIAKWDGNNWSSLGDGLIGSIAAITIDTEGTLYAGGTFENINNIPARNIAAWNGSQWNVLKDAITDEVGMNNEVRSLAIGLDGTLYAGGNFDEAGGKTANRIATWDGSSWGTLGAGTSGFVEAIGVTDTSIFIGGNFALVGSQNVSRIAQWDLNDKKWNALGKGLSNNVSDILVDGTTVYACGGFSLAKNGNEDIIVNNIAKFNTSDREWTPLGTNKDVGLDILANAMVFAPNSNNKIYVGGNFNTSGAIEAKNTALWSSNTALLGTTDSAKKTISIYPNPTSGRVVLNQQQKWSIHNLQGIFVEKGKSQEISMEKYASGVYLLSIENSKEVFQIIKK